MEPEPQPTTAAAPTPAATETVPASTVAAAAAETMTAMDAIRQRKSVRNFSSVPTSEQAAGITAAIAALPRSAPLPGAAAARVVYIPKELSWKSSYGIVGGSKHWIVGSVAKGPYDCESFGYVVERLVIRCTQLGLGTVWLGGSFSVSSFAGLFDYDGSKETILAVSPVGTAATSQGFMRDVMARVVGARTRKPWSEIFFNAKYGGDALTADSAGEFADCLDAVQAAPSARNVQPWVVVMEQTTLRRWHFACHVKSPFNRIDIGIAMAHWDVACESKSLAGHWDVLPGDAVAALALPSGCTYIATWAANN